MRRDTNRTKQECLDAIDFAMRQIEGGMITGIHADAIGLDALRLAMLVWDYPPVSCDHSFSVLIKTPSPLDFVRPEPVLDQMRQAWSAIQAGHHVHYHCIELGCFAQRLADIVYDGASLDATQAGPIARIP
jgi:hypothetical protein